MAAVSSEAAAAGGPQQPDVEVELPRAVVQRLVRARAAAVLESSGAAAAPRGGAKAPAGGEGGAAAKAPAAAKGAQITKDALLAFQESAKVFVNYLASTANDVTKESKRVTMSADDVFRALEELEFTELVQPLRQYLEAHKGTLKEKPAAKKKEGDPKPATERKKRKTAEEAAAPAAQEEGAAETAAPDGAAAEPMAVDEQAAPDAGAAAPGARDQENAS